jgi:hypothetical protein
MFYWLFTEGRGALGGCAPSVSDTLYACLVSAMLGQASSVPVKRKAHPAGNAGRNCSHFVVVLGVSAVYLMLWATWRLTCVDGNPQWFCAPAGAPSSVSTVRLFMLA